MLQLAGDVTDLSQTILEQFCTMILRSAELMRLRGRAYNRIM